MSPTTVTTIQSDWIEGNAVYVSIPQVEQFLLLVRATHAPVVFRLNGQKEGKTQTDGGSALKMTALIGRPQMPKGHVQYVYPFNSITFPEDCFFVPIGSTIVYTHSKGFNTMEEVEISLLAGFATSSDQSEAAKSGVEDAAEYYAWRKSGIASIDTYRSAVSSGHENAYAALLRLIASPPVEGMNIRHFENLGQFVTAYPGDAATLIAMFDAGFQNPSEWTRANSAGFTNYRTYQEALHNGFSTFDIYQEAHKIGVVTMMELERVRAIMKEANEHKIDSFEDYLAVTILDAMVPGQMIGINIFLQRWQQLATQRGILEYGVRRKLLYCAGTAEQVAEHFANCDALYERAFVADATATVCRRQFAGGERGIAILDVSNIAWTNRSRETDEYARAETVVEVAHELHNLGFKQILGIADATLPHDLSSDAQLEMIRKACELTIIESNQSADPHILDLAERKSALIASNDQYRDWLDRSEWRERNIPRVLLPFTYRNDLPDFGTKGQELKHRPD